MRATRSLLPLGMAVADLNTPGEEDRHTVALIGRCLHQQRTRVRGLNNVSNNPNNLLIVLNDNDMSIDNNVGALHNYLSEITTTRRYNRFRYHAYNFCRHHGLYRRAQEGNNAALQQRAEVCHIASAEHIRRAEHKILRAVQRQRRD